TRRGGEPPECPAPARASTSRPWRLVPTPASSETRGPGPATPPRRSRTSRATAPGRGAPGRPLKGPAAGVDVLDVTSLVPTLWVVDALRIAVFAVFGLVVGSFLTVVTERVPRKESI